MAAPANGNSILLKFRNTTVKKKVHCCEYEGAKRFPWESRHSRVKYLKSCQVVRSVAEEVEESEARRRLHFRNRLISSRLRDDESTAGRREKGFT